METGTSAALKRTVGRGFTGCWTCWMGGSCWEGPWMRSGPYCSSAENMDGGVGA